MLLCPFSHFFQDIISLFREGGITVITKNSDDSKIVIKSVIQADADVIHIVNDLEINSHIWQDHSSKIKNIFRRLNVGNKLLKAIAPLVGGIVTLVYAIKSFEPEKLDVEILPLIAMLLGAWFAVLTISRLISFNIFKLSKRTL